MRNPKIQEITSGRDDVLTLDNELGMNLNAWKSQEEISQKRHIDKVFDLPAAKVLRPDRESLDETVGKIMGPTGRPC